MIHEDRCRAGSFGEPFDLVFSAQAWHWVDPVIGAAKAARVLRPGGRFAVLWNIYVHDPEVQAAFTEVYQRHAPALVTSSVTVGSSLSPRDNVHTAPLTASDLFEAVELRSYPWQRIYRRDEWLDQLPTHSNHRTLPPEILGAVLAGIGAAVDRLGGQITVDHSAGLLTTRRTSLPKLAEHSQLGRLTTMRSLVYLVACTLDGYIASLDGATDFFPFEGPQVVDLLAEFPEMFPGHVREPIGITAENQRFDTVLMGRATYEVGQDIGITSPYPEFRCSVVLLISSTRTGCSGVDR
ncbi:MAG: methyltransferase domain-containing protein [Pseudonocardiales bacterium]